MSKYIVKNCPCLSMAEYPSGKVEDNLCGLAITQYCQDCTDCLTKQVIEKCKEPEQVYRNYDNPLTQVQCNTLFGRITLGNEILQLFEIEECDNDK